MPVAFVSEHSETLIELDVEFRHLAGRVGVPTYLRAPTVSVHDAFIAGLARLVATVSALYASGSGARICPARFGACQCGLAP